MADQKLDENNDLWIIDNWGKVTPEEMANQLGVSRATVYARRKRFLEDHPDNGEIHIHIHIHLKDT